LHAGFVIEHVLVPPTPLVSEIGVFPRAYEELEAQMRAEATRNLRRLLARAKKAGIRATALLVRGIAEREIVRSARAKKADLLVLGTHGRTGVARLFLGSVASRVIASAHCPVLTVPSNRSGRRVRGRD
jgi:nucleotide-binding universal stress UspA family protein